MIPSNQHPNRAHKRTREPRISQITSDEPKKKIRESVDTKKRRLRRPSLFWEPRRILLASLMGSTLFIVPTMLKYLEVRVKAHHQLDFIVAGFPKAGTTTLLYAFKEHPEVGMDERESSMIASVTRTTNHVYNVLQGDLARVNSGNTTVQGIKCPTALYGPQTFLRLNEWYPHTKWIIGLRHPLFQVQSYYNYRVTEGYDKFQAAPAWRRLWKPSFRPLQDIYFSNTPWKDVSRFSHRYEFFLSQFIKTKPEWVQREEENVFQVYRKWKQYLSTYRSTFRDSVLSTDSAHIFVYTIDQLTEPSLRQSLEKFLGLTTPLQQLGHENINHFAHGKDAHPESVNLCDPEHASLRASILRDAELTADWIQNELLPHVTVSDSVSFRQSLESWKHDPCSD